MGDVLDILFLVFRVLWGIVQGIWRVVQLAFTVLEWLGLFNHVFRRKKAAQGDKADEHVDPAPLHEVEDAIVTHLGTAPESPHIMHMTPPPDRPLDGDQHDRA
jgi:hypothetical protein